VIAARHASPVRREAGFTILEMLVAMAMFSVLGIAIVSLLSQGLSLFSEGTADTSMQDRLSAALPPIREDLAAMKPVEPPEVPPPPPPAIVDPSAQEPPSTEPVPPAVRLRSGTIKLSDLPADKAVPLPYVAFVRSNARESEDAILRDAGTAGATSGLPLRAYDPAAVDSGVTGTCWPRAGSSRSSGSPCPTTRTSPS
jgi:prepilin-type N-terminal cleavage/methylation domain-containing protein